MVLNPIPLSSLLSKRNLASNSSRLFLFDTQFVILSNFDTIFTNVFNPKNFLIFHLQL
jgi:hypothetical protein